MKALRTALLNSGLLSTYWLKYRFRVLVAVHDPKFRFSASSFIVARVCSMNSVRFLFACSWAGLSSLSDEHAVNTLAPQIIRVAASIH